MKVTISKRLPARGRLTVAIGTFEGRDQGRIGRAGLDRPAGAILRTLLASGDFRARPGELQVLHPAGGRIARLIVVGLGSRAAFDSHCARAAAAAVVRRARDAAAKNLFLIAFDDEPSIARAMGEGAGLGHYRFDRFRSTKSPAPLARVEMIGVGARGEVAMRTGVRIGEAVSIARDLVATPGADLPPEKLAAAARDVGRAAGARVTVHGPRELERLGMGALLAVGRASAHPPRFVILERRAARTRRRPVVVIGKGVTFDSGGLSLKPADGMVRMKYDMSGAAAVIGLFHLLPALDPPFPVVGLIPTAENMPGGRALRPGDVVRTMDGTTVEVTNTDAEGRLLLADALGYARKLEPECVVDLATLTGAIRIALGSLAAGLFTPDDALAGELEAAAAATGERVWRMPVWEEYEAELRSDTADLVNSASRDGGASIAAAFLARFARGMRWAHLDIASTAWSLADRPDQPRGPTGFGVRLLAEWISRKTASA